MPGMLEQRSGAIVHVSSLQWKRPHPSSPAYGPAKAALTSYSKVLANEFGPMGIRVNTVTPGYIATSGAEARIKRTMDHAGIGRDEAEAELLAANGGVPLGRPGNAAEVAQLVAFLVSVDNGLVLLAHWLSLVAADVPSPADCASRLPGASSPRPASRPTMSWMSMRRNASGSSSRRVMIVFATLASIASR